MPLDAWKSSPDGAYRTAPRPSEPLACSLPRTRRKERSRSFVRKFDAQRWLAAMETTKLDGSWTDPTLGRVLFGDWLTEWQRTTTNRRPTTEVRDDSIIRTHVRPRFGGVPLAAIGQRDVRAWVAELAARRLAPTTVRKVYQVFSKVMAAAVDAGMIARSPCRNVPLPKVDHKEMRFLTPAEVARLARTIDQGYRALVLVAAYGGLRVGELAGLRRRDLDLTRYTVEVTEVVTEPRGMLHVGPPKRSEERR